MRFHGQNRLSSRKPRTLHLFHGHSLSKVVLAKIIRMISETQQLFHTSAEANPLQSSSISFEDLNSQVLKFSFSQRGPQACECCTSAKHHLLAFQMLRWTSEICVKLQVHSNLPMSTNCFKWGHAQQLLPWPFSEPRRGLESLRFEKAQTNEVKNAIQESWYHIENHRNIWPLLYSVCMSIRDSGFEASKLFVLMMLMQVPVIADAFCISASLGHKSQKCETLKLRTWSIRCDSRPLYPSKKTDADLFWNHFKFYLFCPTTAARICTNPWQDGFAHFNPFHSEALMQAYDRMQMQAMLWKFAKSTSIVEGSPGKAKLDTSMASFKMLTPLSHSSSLTSLNKDRIEQIWTNSLSVKLQLQDLNLAIFESQNVRWNLQPSEQNKCNKSKCLGQIKWDKSMSHSWHQLAT